MTKKSPPDAPESLGGDDGWQEHLEELRRRVIAVLAIFFAAFLAAFAVADRIAAFLTAPVAHLGAKLYTFAPADKFMAYLHLAAWAAMVATAPFFVLQAGLFVWPGLKKSERRYTAVLSVTIPTLFLTGAAAAYRFIAPLALRFFLRFAEGDGIQALWGLREYLSLLAGLLLGAGLLLQMPIFLLVLFALGVTTPQRVARYRPHVVLLLFFLAAVCTPPDVISQVLLGVPLYLLFEGTLVIGKFQLRKTKQKQ